MDDIGSSFTQVLDIDEDPVNYIDFSDEIGDDISNGLINSVSNAIPVTPTKNMNVSIQVGMEFPNRNDVIDLYRAFGWTKGFGIRVRQSIDNYMKLTCSRQGFAPAKKTNVDEVRETKSRKTSSSRIGCQAYLKASINGETNMWRITFFDDNHNHVFVSPKSVPLIRSHRKMPDVAKSLVEKFSESGLPTGKVATILKGQDLSFDSRDCYNYMKSVRKKIYDDGDAQAVVRYCNKQQSLNPNFFYSIKYDDDDRMESFFWIDARSKHAYELFGDVITFDTTYRTNKYALPFGPFVGVNNHCQSILFGCALLKDETEDTFVWLFEEWLRAMNGKHPGAIITDQDKAITNAVAKVFPNSKHRFCIWHIMKKFPEKLSHVYQDNGTFKKEINDCIYKSCSAQDFEDTWQRILVQCGLSQNEWMRSLYSIRSYWVPIFNRSTFFAGMQSTQRSESINAFFDDFVTSGTTLKEFVEKYNQAVDARYESLKKENFESMHKERRLQYNMLLEKHAARVYTRAIYKKFVEELSHILSLSKEKIGIDGEWVTYRVFNKRDIKDLAIVEIKLETREARCSCLYFEFMGILCRHVLTIFFVENVEEIPEHFILRRWTKEGNDMLGKDKVLCFSDGDGLVHDLHLSSECSRLIELAHRSEKTCRFISDGLKCLVASAEEFSISEEGNGFADLDVQYLESQPEEYIMMNLKDPKCSQTKGRKRIRSGIEESSKQTTICGNCKKKGHNKRTCKEINL